jgi:hypothetical protein
MKKTFLSISMLFLLIFTRELHSAGVTEEPIHRMEISQAL